MLVRAPGDWAEECRGYAAKEADPEAKAAYQQIATEFEAVDSEIEGLLAALDALNARHNL